MNIYMNSCHVYPVFLVIIPNSYKCNPILPMLKFRVHILKPEWTAVPVQGIHCRMWRIQRPNDWDPEVLFPKLAECLSHPPLLAKIKVTIIHFLHNAGRMKQVTCL